MLLFKEVDHSGLYCYTVDNPCCGECTTMVFSAYIEQNMQNSAFNKQIYQTQPKFISRTINKNHPRQFFSGSLCTQTFSKVHEKVLLD